jgi:hypothetical protein
MRAHARTHTHTHTHTHQMFPLKAVPIEPLQYSYTTTGRRPYVTTYKPDIHKYIHQQLKNKL